MSDTADYNDELFEDELIRVSESDDIRSRTTLKDRFTSSVIADIYVILRSFLLIYRLVLPIIKGYNPTNLL